MDEADAISLAELSDLGYTVDMTKATPWRRAPGAVADALHRQLAGGPRPVIDEVVIELVSPRPPDGR